MRVRPGGPGVGRTEPVGAPSGPSTREHPKRVRRGDKQGAPSARNQDPPPSHHHSKHPLQPQRRTAIPGHRTQKWLAASPRATCAGTSPSHPHARHTRDTSPRSPYIHPRIPMPFRPDQQRPQPAPTPAKHDRRDCPGPRRNNPRRDTTDPNSRPQGQGAPVPPRESEQGREDQGEEGGRGGAEDRRRDPTTPRCRGRGRHTRRAQTR